MKVCITSQGNNLDSQISQIFGRCQYFIFVDTDTLEFEAVKNQNISGSGGVGIKSGQLVVGKQAETILTGYVGPNAAKTLQAAGVNIVLDISGSVKEVVEKYKNGEFEYSNEPNVKDKSGSGKS